MNKLHKNLLLMYKHIRKEFDRNNVRHFAIGGTAIGAFREKGFIPWDDDIDIAIFEEDLNAFKKSILDAGYSFEDVSLTAQPMIKVFDKSVVINIDGHKQFLFIDFMIAQNKRKWSLFRWMKQNILNTIGAARSLTFNELKRIEGKGAAIGYKILAGVTFFLTGKYLKNKIINHMLETKLDKKKENDYRYLYHVRRTEKYNVSEIKDIKFESEMMPINTAFQEDMRDVFGDIMKKPNSNQMINHGVNEVNDGVRYSLIVPTHNRSRLIGPLLDKLSKIHNSEIVLVENGSSKEEKRKYEKLLKKYINSNIIYSSNEWGNLQKARKHGFELANGEYIWQIDDDDMVTDEFINFLNKFMPAKDLYRFPYRRYGGKILPNKGKVNKPSKLFHSMEVSTFLFKKDMLDNSIFNENVSMFEDQLFGKCIYEAFKNSAYINVESIIYDQYKIEESMTRSKREIKKDAAILKFLNTDKIIDLVIYKKVFVYQLMDSKSGVYSNEELINFYLDKKQILSKRTGLRLLDSKVKRKLKNIKIA